VNAASALWSTRAPRSGVPAPWNDPSSPYAGPEADAGPRRRGDGGAPALGSLREILRLAVPALGALVAQPLFVLIDAGIVGTLGTLPLAGLGAAATLVSLVLGLCIFLAYATTSSVARRVGEGRWDAAVSEGVEGMALGRGLGVGVKDYRAVYIFRQRHIMERFIEQGLNVGGQADATAKANTQGEAYGGQLMLDGIKVYQLTESGLALQATIRSGCGTRVSARAW